LRYRSHKVKGEIVIAPLFIIMGPEWAWHGRNTVMEGLDKELQPCGNAEVRRIPRPPLQGGEIDFVRKAGLSADFHKLAERLKMDKVRLGVIGAGSFTSRRHIPTIIKSPDAELVSLCRRNEEMLRKMADHFGCQNTFTDYQQMLDEVEMDGVLVTTPHALHYQHAKAALEKGLHVMLEKPMAIKASEARELVDIAKNRGLVIVIAYNPPFWQHTTYMREAISSGVLGEIEGVHINWIGNAEHVFGLVPMRD